MANKIRNLSTIAALALLGSACTAGVPSDGESIEGLSDAVSPVCNTVSGIMPTKASLATAMGIELGRWEPLTDLVVVNSNGYRTVALSSAGVVQCAARGSSCANTKAILGLQDVAANQVINQNRFNATAFREDLVASYGRQLDRTNHLKKNYPAQLAAAHTLTKVGGPTNLGIGACGPHYLFRPTTPAGGAYPNPGNLINNLYFFGEPINDFLSFRVLNNSADVGIDPIDGDNAPPTTVTGTCPTYELDRVYSPESSLNGKCCVTVSGVNGALHAVPRATGYFGCKGGAIPTR